MPLFQQFTCTSLFQSPEIGGLVEKHWDPAREGEDEDGHTDYAEFNRRNKNHNYHTVTEKWQKAVHCPLWLNLIQKNKKN